MQVDKNDPNSVLWLQQALMRVSPGHAYIPPTGAYDAITIKVVTNFQRFSKLPETGEPDAETVARIEQELAVLDAQPYKKKRVERTLPVGKPGDQVG
jgi:peptidoglycan hydrolase-like protein with peptidoglycan-binding domain